MYTGDDQHPRFEGRYPPGIDLSRAEIHATQGATDPAALAGCGK